MPGQPVQVGPFLGGLNTYSDPTAVADNQVVKAENFELDLDGSLKNRPPIVARGVDFPLGPTGNMQILGYYYASQNVPYLLASDGLSSTYYLSGDAWVLVTDTIAASAMTQFNAKAWLLAPEGSSNPGGSWDPVGGFVADANMPKGECIVAHKFRLWVAVGKNAANNATRLLFSDILGQPTLWPTTPEFIDVGAGDGQAIVQLTTYYQALLLFRTNSIYNFTYNSDPASGNVNEVVPGVGLENKDCLVAFEDYLYFFYKGRAYEFINNRANQINVQVPFESTSESGIYKAYTVSRYSRRIVFGYYDTLYVFNLSNRTWSTWVSTTHGAIGQFFESPADSSDTISAVTHSSEIVPPGTTTAVNLFLDPALTVVGSFAVSATAGAKTVVAPTTTTGLPVNGSSVATVGKFTASAVKADQWYYGSLIDVAQGTQYAFQMYFMGVAKTASAVIQWCNAAGTPVSNQSGNTLTASSTEWSQLFASGLPPVGATQARIGISINQAATDVVYFACAQYEVGTVPTAFFYGDSTDTSSATYSWSATANNSTSIATVARRTATLFSTDALTSDSEPMQCSITTKNFDYQAAGQYKKLSYWGLDAVFKTTATATIHPISVRRSITWTDLLATDWTSELAFTWDQPLSGSYDIVSTITSSGSTRKFVKLDKALRFRQVNFQAVFDTDGSIDTAPVRLFSMTTYVVAKEHVSKQLT